MIYEWPQGRIVRTICVLAVLLIAADLAVGASAAWTVWAETPDRPLRQAFVGSVLGLTGLFALVGGLLAILILPRPARFLIEVEQEMAKVTWPGKSDVVRSTIVITVMTVILAMFIFVVDLINVAIVTDWLFQLGN